MKLLKLKVHQVEGVYPSPHYSPPGLGLEFRDIGTHWGNFGVILGLYRGIMEQKMETTI